MNFGFFQTAACVNVAAPPDTRCEDPAFQEANPDLCPARSELIIKPEVSLVCALGSTQFGAFLLVNGIETDVTADSIFATSNPAVALVGAGSGNATGVAQGVATISATYSTYTATAEMNVIGSSGDCCSQQEVAMMVLVDTSRSMSQSFSGSYTSRLHYARAAAQRFISEINVNKDTIGLIAFNNTDATILSVPTADIATVEALAAAISQTQEKTGFYAALNLAIAELDTTTADLKAIILISDGEDTSDGAGNNYVGTNNPITLLRNFRTDGGIVMCLGCRASGAGFALLSEFSTGGFFVNGYSGTESDSLDFLSGLKGYICAGDCTPDGDIVEATPSLNYTGFINWDVSGGSVDLIGAGLFDFLPGNGLYVDLAGSSLPAYGKMTTKVPISLTGGDSYRLSLDMAGNQRVNLTPFAVTVKVYSLSGTTEIVAFSQVITINDHAQDFEPFSYTFTPAGDMDVYISIQQTSVPPASSYPGCQYWGLLLNQVTLDNVTDSVNVFTDNFDAENLQYVSPRCGLATTWYNGQYAYGYNCYGEGCLDEPIPIQSPDPSPLANIESGGTTTPTIYTSTKTECASCPAGSTNVDDVSVDVADALIPAMTSNTAPSGEASASSSAAASYAWYAFDTSLSNSWISNNDSISASGEWIAYDFAAPTTVGAYSLDLFRTQGFHEIQVKVQGSNDGTNWTTLHEQTGITIAIAAPFALPVSFTFRQYRLLVTSDTQAGAVMVTSFQLYSKAGRTEGSTQVCRSATATSTDSQSAADAAASAAALALATAELNCEPSWTKTETAIVTCPNSPVSATGSGTYTSFISEQDAITKAYALALIAAQANLDCTGSTNEQTITLPATNWNLSAYGPASPFPSTKYVADSGPITKVTVTFFDIQPCPNGNSWNIFLTSPEGTTVLLWSDQGTTQPIPSEITVTIDDDEAAMPAGALTDGASYAPNNGGLQPVLGIPATAPQPPYSLTLAAFAGDTDKQGTWALWIVLRTTAASSILNGWDLTIT